MQGRLAAPPESRGCLDLAAIEALESRDGIIRLEQADTAARIAELREFLRKSSAHADAVLGEQFWAGVDVVQLVHARAWFVEQLLLLAWKKLVPFVENVSLVAVGGYGRGE
jgi:[protein-PII] uridylyltransferase